MTPIEDYGIFMAHCRKTDCLWLETLEALGPRDHFLTALLLEHSSPEGTREEACVCKAGLHFTTPRSQSHLTLAAMWTLLLELFSAFFPKITFKWKRNYFFCNSFVKSEIGNFSLLSPLNPSFLHPPPNWNLVLYKLSRSREALEAKLHPLHLKEFVGQRGQMDLCKDVIN